MAQKSQCACQILSIATIKSKYYFNFILIRTRSGRELFDRPRMLGLKHAVHSPGTGFALSF